MTIRDLMREQNAQLNFGNWWLRFSSDTNQWVLVNESPHFGVHFYEYEIEAVKALCELEGIGENNMLQNISARAAKSKGE